MPKAYISRTEKQSTELATALRDKGFDVICQPQIEREYIPLPESMPEAEWCFFSSPFAVESYIAQKQKENYKYAGIGSGTCNKIRQFAQPEFEGRGDDLDAVAADFRALVKDEKVLFLAPEKGLRRVQNSFPDEQVIELICYRTFHSPVKIEECDLYIFSSPSNVKAFAEKNEFPEKARYFTFGESTFKELNSRGVKNIDSTKSYADEVLIKAIFSKFVS